MAKKWVYFFSAKETDGSAQMRDLLGGKGANLAEMCTIGLPVPPGFTITTEACIEYLKTGKVPAQMQEQVGKALQKVEKIMGRRFGDPANPLFFSVRSGAKFSMPGMMDTVLNLGMNDKTMEGIAKLFGNRRFAMDAYRRFITMFGNVVMNIKKEAFDEKFDAIKEKYHAKYDTDLDEKALEEIVREFKNVYRKTIKSDFPTDPMKQLTLGITAVFKSWNTQRAFTYRNLHNLPHDMGTAANVQVMVFGNLNDNSATGVAFTRDPATGDRRFFGEYLIKAQGEDVVAGIRTPRPINKAGKTSAGLPSLEEVMPKLYKELESHYKKLEKHYRDMQDIEFTIENGKLYMLQCRVGKRNGVAAVRMATDMYKENLIDAQTAVLRVAPNQLVELLLPMLDPKAELATAPIAKGLPAGPGGAKGRAVFTSEDAVAWAARGEKVILVREETSPEDVDGMHKSQAILTSKGGMTSHAALVARGWGKCCIVGCSDVEVRDDGKSFVTKKGNVIKEGDWISLNGTSGLVYEGGLPLVDIDLEHNKSYGDLMKLVDKIRVLKIRTNADTPKDSAKAIEFGAEGIGLFRTEHMFYGEGSDKPLFLLRKMIMSRTAEERRRALDELFVFVKGDIKATLEVMDGRPVTIRLLDPPLHEFVPHSEDKMQALAKELGVNMSELHKRAESLRENNPMLGHRGVRLGITYPEITEMQVRAILEAAGELVKEGKKANPEIMVPVTGHVNELKNQKVIVDRVYPEVCAKLGVKKISFLYGTMIEIPRAALTANRMAEAAEFFSYGTNDLTQMGFGFSRDDIGSFLPDYLNAKILPVDPFQTIDQEGIGELIKIGIERGRATRPRLKVGICGEHGGEPESVKFCHRVGMDYVSCSPFRVPIARLAAAHAAIEAKARKAAPKR